LEGDLFSAGVRPAINVGLSVSRVGGNAQTKAMKQVAGMLRLSLAQHRELAAFAQLSTDLDKATRDQLTHGDRMVEILKQDILTPIPLAKQVLIIFAGINHYLDDIKLELVKKFETEFLAYIDQKHSAIEHEIQTQKALSPTLDAKLRSAIEAFKNEFQSNVIASEAKQSQSS
jgi:F-type H+-transporting ATPase subunit alpha